MPRPDTTFRPPPRLNPEFRGRRASSRELQSGDAAP